MGTPDKSVLPIPFAGVLMGGRSRRMGRSKATLGHPSGTTLIEHTVAVAKRVSQNVFLLGDAESLPSSLSDVPRLPDPVPDAGPLAGLCSLLTQAGGQWSFLCACDMPFVSAELVERLASNISPDVDAVAFERRELPGKFHATCALYHPRLLPALRTELEHGIKSLHAVLEQARLVTLHPNADEAQQLTNLNTPEDYARLMR